MVFLREQWYTITKICIENDLSGTWKENTL